MATIPDKESVKKLAIEAGFKLKQQPDGSDDLNPYVYQFAAALIVETMQLNGILEPPREVFTVSGS